MDESGREGRYRGAAAVPATLTGLRDHGTTAGRVEQSTAVRRVLAAPGRGGGNHGTSANTQMRTRDQAASGQACEAENVACGAASSLSRR